MRLAIMVIGVVALVGLGLGARFFLGGESSDDVAQIVDAATVPSTTNEDGSLSIPVPDLPSPDVPADGGTDLGLSETPTVPTPTPVPPAPGPDPVFAQPVPEPEVGPFRLSLPIDCQIGQTCYIQSFVNAGLESEPRDYACGALTYDTHRGTDFRLIDYTQMESGVNVLAAAPGTVILSRDGMPDANFKLFGRDAVSDRSSGNVVGIDHGNGTITAYAHLRRDSVAVTAGQQVTRGQVIGQVGMSGLTEFPHVHFEVMQDGVFIDPFTSAAQNEGCGLQGESLWRDDVAALLSYPRTLIMRTGFSDRILNRAAVEYRLFPLEPLTEEADALVFHVYLSGIQEGDGFVAEVTAPDGTRFVKSGRRFDSFQREELLAIGRDQLQQPLQIGTYTVTFQYYRRDENGEDVEILTFDDTVIVE